MSHVSPPQKKKKNPKTSPTNNVVISSNLNLPLKLFFYLKNTPSVPLCLSSILFWNIPKYCPVSKNKNH